MLDSPNLRLAARPPGGRVEQAVLRRLGAASTTSSNVTVARRGYDARSPPRDQPGLHARRGVADEAAVLRRCAGDPRVGPAPPDPPRRPVPLEPEPPPPRGGRRRPLRPDGGAGPGADGLPPAGLERGQPVRQRTKDTWGLWRRGVLEPESNVQFGEGGAGTFSDGKLYSQIRDPRHLGRKVLEEFVRAGRAGRDPLGSKPHIGTFRW
jgi:hypothetical protein